MNERDSWLIAIGLAGLAASVIMLCWIVRDMRTDIELLRITAAVPAIERYR